MWVEPNLESEMLSLMLIPALLAPAPAVPNPGSLEELATFMTGRFSSADQAKADPKNFFDIRLEVSRIWKDRTDGVWLYVEQAAADSLAKPYRQRIYHLTRLPEGRFQSVIYSFSGDALRFAGAWKEPAKLEGLKPEHLEARKGCAVFLIHRDGRYLGSTRERECESALRGAAYATTEVEISSETLISWDRGYDTAGVQVWGAKTGGYRFQKLSR